MWEPCVLRALRTMLTRQVLSSLQASKHTIVLLQTAPAAASRTYFDFSTPAQAYDAIARMYEDRLKQINPNARNITYDVQDLFRYLDSLQDISLLM